MREAKAEFPPLSVGLTSAPSQSYNAESWSAIDADAANSKFAAISEVEIDLSGLQIQERVLTIEQISLGRLPSFNTTPSPDGTNNWDFITDIHFVTTAPLCYDADVTRAGDAPSQNRIYQMNKLLQDLQASNFTDNNGYYLPTFGINPGSSGGDLFLPNLNFDVKQLMYIRCDTLATNLQSLPTARTPFSIVDSTTYGMGTAAALDKMYVYRLVIGKATIDSLVNCVIGPSVVQMITNTPKPDSNVRLNLMDLNFNNTNPLA